VYDAQWTVRVEEMAGHIEAIGRASLVGIAVVRYGYLAMAIQAYAVAEYERARREQGTYVRVDVVRELDYFDAQCTAVLLLDIDFEVCNDGLALEIEDNGDMIGAIAGAQTATDEGVDAP
jgi:hypothetical protein